MSKAVDIDGMMDRFRLASREVFNQYFRASDPYGDEGWKLAERFSSVQSLLFQKLVAEPASLGTISYGDLQPEILVDLRPNLESVPALINREIKSGYWDYPVKEIPKGSKLSFVSFFDWDQLDYRDNQYVKVQVEHLPSHPEVNGKQALIESRHVVFIRTKHGKA
jgi:hypothetical protein